MIPCASKFNYQYAKKVNQINRGKRLPHSQVFETFSYSQCLKINLFHHFVQCEIHARAISKGIAIVH